MKTKSISVLALILVSAFFLSAIVAAGTDEATLPQPMVQSPSPAPSPTPTPIQSPWADTPLDNPFTPDGQGTVVDNAMDEDGKEFFTFTTPDGNDFFLVIDRSRGRDNVYFLNAVTEQDLLSLAEGNRNTIFSPFPNSTPAPAAEEPDDELDIPNESEVSPSNNGTLIFIIFATFVFSGVAYYLKIVRPKKQSTDLDEEDFEDDEVDDEDELEFEDYDEEEEKLFDEI